MESPGGSTASSMFSPPASSALGTKNMEASAVDDDLDLDFEPRATAYEKAKVSSSRLFGKREKKFGGGNIMRKRFGRRGRLEHQNPPLREELASPAEVVRRRLSETPDFADCGADNVSKARQRSFTSEGPSKTPRRPLQRTVSLQVSSTTNNGEGLSHVSSFASLVQENSNPNFDDPPDLPRERKKIKARRHSFAVPPPASRQSSASSGSSALPPDLQWLAPQFQTPSSNKTQDSAEAFAALSQGSAGSLSTTPSRRKRGVCSSPHSSDADDFLQFSGSSYSGSRRSRSRIFSLEESIQPCRNGSNDPMDESSAEESCASSPDTSMEMDAIPKTPAPLPRQTRTILETMASIDDLEFLLGELKKSFEGPLFGSNTLNVVPPSSQWSCQRRTQFVAWTTNHLGFSRCSAGTGYPYVRISKNRGLQILTLLEAATREREAMPEMEEEAQTSIFSSFRSPAGTPALNAETSAMYVRPQIAVSRLTIVFFSRKTNGTISKSTPDSIAVDLAGRLASLTFSEASTRDPAAHTVTIDERSTGRPSIQSTVRSSLDSQFGSTDMNFQHFGISPRVGNSGRPPKMSFGSWSSSIKSGASNPQAQGMTPCAERLKMPLTSVKFAGTPMNKDCRVWGSRPMAGRDWGISQTCDADLLSEYMELCEMRSDETEESESLDEANLSCCSLDIEADLFIERHVDPTLTKKEADRADKRKLSSFNKRKRMSLFATAIGTQAGLPHKKFSPRVSILCEEESTDSSCHFFPAATLIGKDDRIVPHILSYMDEEQLLTTVSSICTYWSKAATDAHVNLLLRSVQETESNGDYQPAPILERSWQSMHKLYPWACFLAEGGAKYVYKVHNSRTHREEALSVMDVSEMDNVQIVANELAVSAMLSSFVRRGLCPNFIKINSVFTCAYPPPDSCWGGQDNRYPRGKSYDLAGSYRQPRVPKVGHPGRYQYISMELVNEGDAEEFIKHQQGELIHSNLARNMLFQIAFSLFAAADKFSVKHYDVKLLNIFVQRLSCSNSQGAVLRYGLGSHVFSLLMPQDSTVIAKLADFGTANVDPCSSGQPIGIAHFTTLENTPPDFFILGDDAQQGHEHDSFGLGLCMLHLFTGYRPYEEIMESVSCPPSLQKRLSDIWEDESQEGFSIMNNIIFDGVDQDDDGNLLGEPDHTFYDTLYRYLVLFGIPDVMFNQKSHNRVWKAINDSLVAARKKVTKACPNDKTQFSRDCKKFSIRKGNNKYIARARNALAAMDGGLELLFHLCSFDPSKRATPLQVLNSKFMVDLRESCQDDHGDADIYSYMSFATAGSSAV